MGIKTAWSRLTALISPMCSSLSDQYALVSKAIIRPSSSKPIAVKINSSSISTRSADGSMITL